MCAGGEAGRHDPHRDREEGRGREGQELHDESDHQDYFSGAPDGGILPQPHQHSQVWPMVWMSKIQLHE